MVISCQLRILVSGSYIPSHRAGKITRETTGLILRRNRRSNFRMSVDGHTHGRLLVYIYIYICVRACVYVYSLCGSVVYLSIVHMFVFHKISIADRCPLLSPLIFIIATYSDK